MASPQESRSPQAANTPDRSSASSKLPGSENLSEMMSSISIDSVPRQHSHRKAYSAGFTQQSPSAVPPSPLSSYTQSSHDNSPHHHSSLNPHAGGFRPGPPLDQVLEEPSHDTSLDTPKAGSFQHNPFPDASAAPGFQYPIDHSHPPYLASPYTANHPQQHQQPPPNLAQQLQQLQSLPQAGVNDMQSALLAQLQMSIMAQQQQLQQQSPPPHMLHHQPPPPPPPQQQVPPRFANLQQPPQPSTQDMNNMVAEQMSIQAQIDLLSAQQEALHARWSSLQQQQHHQQASQSQPQQAAASAPPSAGIPGINSPASNVNNNRTIHRRHQSQQPHTPNYSAFSAGQMGQIGAQVSPSQVPQIAQLSEAERGHGRRHSVNVMGQSQQGHPSKHHHSALSFDGAAGGFQFPPSSDPSHQNGPPSSELDFGARVSTAPASHAPTHHSQPSHGGGHARSGSLQTWGTNSSRALQTTLSTGTTDLAQAQAQLQQLSHFRSSSGHAKVPSFGLPHLGGGNQFAGPTPTNFGGGHGGHQRKNLFAPYLPQASIPPLLSIGKLVIGTLRVNKRNRSDAYVSAENLDADVYICGSKDRNRALEGDVVAVELLDVDEVWGTKKEKEEKKRKKEENASHDVRAAQNSRRQDKKNDDVEVEGQGLTLFEEEEVTDNRKPEYAGHVVSIVHRTAGQLFSGTLGLLRPSSAATKEKQEAERRERDGVDMRGAAEEDKSKTRICWFKPVDKRVPLIAIPIVEAPEDFLENHEAYANRLAVATVKRWPITSLHPFGTLVEQLGQIGDVQAETRALLKDYSVVTDDFPENAVKCLPPVPWTIPEHEVASRKDYRDELVFTVDDESAKDLDDAIHIKRVEDGCFEVGIHIADVSYFVKTNTPLDREAKKRATSVYLVQQFIPMLPNVLGTSLCSLTPGEDKLTFSTVFKLNPEGQILSTWFGKTIIKSHARLSYNQVEQVIKGSGLSSDIELFYEAKHEEITSRIKDIHTMSKVLRKQRLDEGAVSIHNDELDYTLIDNDMPIDCRVRDRTEAHTIIEEFAILTNINVARKIAAALPEQALLRRHPAPLDRRIVATANRLATFGFNIDTSSREALAKGINGITDPVAAPIVALIARKLFGPAKYFCSGSFDISQYSHFALNSPLYCHFTSPIRRYSDIVVHRQLEASLSSTPDTKFTLDTDGVAAIAQNCNVRKAAATLAEEQSQHLYLCVLISELTKKYGPVIRPAVVIGVQSEAFDVMVLEFGMEKRVHIEAMPIENHVHDETANTLAIYWRKGVDVVKWLAEHRGDDHLHRMRKEVERHANMIEASSRSIQAESDLFDDDDDDAPENGATKSDKPKDGTEKSSTGNEASPEESSTQVKRSAAKTPFKFQGVEITPAGHHIQTVKIFQTVPVIVTADLSKSPPVLKVLAVNPFAKD